MEPAPAFDQSIARLGARIPDQFCPKEDIEKKQTKTSANGGRNFLGFILLLLTFTALHYFNQRGKLRNACAVLPIVYTDSRNVSEQDSRH
jgi:hypothetical protein